MISRPKQFKTPHQYPLGTPPEPLRDPALRIDACIFTEENVQRSADFSKKSVFWDEKDRNQKNQEPRTED